MRAKQAAEKHAVAKKEHKNAVVKAKAADKKARDLIIKHHAAIAAKLVEKKKAKKPVDRTKK